MMYNKDIKESYIIEKENVTCVPERELERCFERTYPYEERLNKDVCNFTFYEIVDMYKTWNVKSYERLLNLNSYLSQYTDWCLQKTLVPDSQNHFSEMTKDIYLSCINKTYNDKRIVTREQVLWWAKSMPNPSDGFIFLALFEGIKGHQYEELTKLQISDFHDGNVTLCTGRTINVSDELYNFALISSQTFEYNSVNGQKVFRFSENENPNLIVKNYHNTISKTNETAGARLRRRIERNCDLLEIGQYMNGQSLYDSGKIHFIKQESERLGITAKDYLYKHIEEIENQFGQKIHRATVFYDKYKKYLG